LDEAVEVFGADADQVLPDLRRTSRDNARTPMQWNAESHGGFTDGVPWIGTNPNFRTINAATQLDIAGSVYEFYRSLIQLHHDEPVVAHGDFRMLVPEHPTLFAFIRSLGVTRMLVLANFSGQPLELTDSEGFAPADWNEAELILANYPPVHPSAQTAMRPWEVRVLWVDVS
jgi:oligo-1,6-glucosidase